MITGANAIKGAAEIADARPELIDKIVPAILSVTRARYDTRECRNVAIGHVLDALQRLWPRVKDRADVVTFVRRQQSNSRPAAARRARGLSAAGRAGGVK